MAEISPRAWFLLGHLHLAAAAGLGLVAASPSDAVDPWVHVLLATGGIFLVSGGLLLGFLPPFLKREVASLLLARGSLALVLLADAAAAAAPFLQLPPWRVLAGGYALAFLALVGNVALSAVAGRPWRGGIALFHADQPFRRGDLLAATAFGASLLGLVAAAVAGLAPPRPVPTAYLAAFLLGHALPFHAGVLFFLLPRNAKEPLPGATLHVAALGILLAAAAALVGAFAFPGPGRLRFPASAVLLALLLHAWAWRRLPPPVRPGPQLRRARPFLRGAFALAPLAGLVLALSAAWDLPGPLLPVAAYAFLVLGGLLSVAATLLAGPILLNAVPREGRWAPMAAALAILALFLLAPHFQYPRSAFPGALVLAVAQGLVLWGLAPMRAPRRACDP